MGHKTLLYLIDGEISQGTELELPLNEKDGSYYVHFDIVLPRLYDFLEESDLEIPISEINSSAIIKAHNTIRFCDQEYTRLIHKKTNNLIKNKKPIPPMLGFEIGFKMLYILRPNGSLYIKDLIPKSTRSYNFNEHNGTGVSARVNGDHDCHYHPNHMKSLYSIIQSSLLSAQDVYTYLDKGNGGILSYDKQGNLNLHVYHIKKIDDKIIAVAPQSIIRTTKDYNFDGIRIITEELDDIKQPKCYLKESDGLLWFHVDFD